MTTAYDFTFEVASEMYKELDKTKGPYIRKVYFSPKEEEEHNLFFIHDSKWILTYPYRFFIGYATLAKWPQLATNKDYSMRDFTYLGYSPESTIPLPRLIAMKEIGCRREWLAPYRCFVDNENHLDMRKKNIRFQTLQKIYDPETYGEWTIEELRKLYNVR